MNTNVGIAATTFWNPISLQIKPKKNDIFYGNKY